MGADVDLTGSLCLESTIPNDHSPYHETVAWQATRCHELGSYRNRSRDLYRCCERGESAATPLMRMK